MIFANIEYLFLLVLLIPYIIWYVMKRKKTEPTLQVSTTRMYMKAPKSWKIYLLHTPFVLRTVAIIMVILILARPQTTDNWQNTEIEGIDIMLAVDVSTSMLAEDLKPNRLEAAKQVASEFINGRPNDNIGLTIFAGESFTQCPLTVDHGVLLNLFNSIKGDIAQRGLIEDGTAIGMGIANAVTRLKDSKAKSKVIILLTDGSNNRGDISPLTAAEIAKQFGIRIYTIGVGTNGTAPYPMQTYAGTQYVNVPVEIDEKTLTEIAGTTNGNYFRATSISKYRPDIKFWLTFAALTLVILMLARPQFGSKMETVKRSGVEAVIALDISNSMLAEDVTPSRLDKSKKLISRLVDTFNNDKVGLIVFAGDAFTQLPITSDYVSAKMFLETINPSLITTQGTDIGAAIRLAMKSFTPQEGVGRAIIVITDGENHEGGAVEAAQEAAEKGMQVFVLGVGSPDGSPIPAEDGSNNFRRDKDGNVIVTRLNEQMCQEIAKAGNGMYIRVDNTNSAEKVLNNEIAKLSKADVESQVYTEFDEQFQALAWLMLILLVVEMLILERKNPLFKNVRLFK